MTTHSPAPWKLAGQRTIIDANDDHVASIAQFNDNTEADMALVLAAPQMLDGLRTILFAVTGDADNNDGKVDRLAVAMLCRDLIAAATTPVEA